MTMIARTSTGGTTYLQCTPDGLLRTATAPVIEARYNIGAVAANVEVFTDPIDLGPAETRQYTRILAIKHGVASAGETLIVQWSDNLAAWRNAHAAIGSSHTGASTNTSSALIMHAQAVPMGRYIRMRYQNGSTEQTALYLALTAIAGI